MHDNLVSGVGALLFPESSMGTDVSKQQQALSQEHEVTLLLKPVPWDRINSKFWIHTSLPLCIQLNSLWSPLETV